MTLTIEVTPEVGRTLEENAAHSGLSVTEYAAAVLARAQPWPYEANGSPVDIQSQDIAARLAAFRSWQEEIANTPNPRSNADVPPMLDDGNESVSRADFYGYTECEHAQL